MKLQAKHFEPEKEEAQRKWNNDEVTYQPKQQKNKKIYSQRNRLISRLFPQNLNAIY